MTNSELLRLCRRIENYEWKIRGIENRIRDERPQVYENAMEPQGATMVITGWRDVVERYLAGERADKI